MQFLEVSLALVDQPGLDVDEVIVMQLVHPSQQI